MEERRMEGDNRIEIVDKEGWRKEFIVQKRLIYIGSDPRNDIVLNPVRGAGVAPRHLQLITTPSGSGGGASAVNLCPVAIQLGQAVADGYARPDGFMGGPNRVLEPNTATLIADGESLHLGEFTLVFRISTVMGMMPVQTSGTPSEPAQAVAGSGRSASIGVRISLTQPYLMPENPVDGVVYVTNQGAVPGVQFNLGLEGLPPDCYEIGPAPILFPGAEKGVPVRIFHPRRPGFPAGSLRLRFFAQANEAYPGEVASVVREIRLMPFYHHMLRLFEVR
jgi:hypothetical protein